MAIWSELGKRAADATAKTVEQARILSETARLNSLISDEEASIADSFQQIGRRYYEIHCDDCEDTFTGMIAAVKNAERRIEQYRNKILEVKGVVRCGNCGAEIAKEAAFCSTCGAVVPARDLGRKCRNCGEAVEDGMRFCTHCGLPLDEVDTESVEKQELPQRSEIM